MPTHANTKEDFAVEIAPAIVPKAPWRIAFVCPMPGFRLLVRFNDGIEGTVAMSALIHSPGAGVFAALRDEKVFSEVGLHYGAVTWPGELDLAPDAMYEAISRGGEYVLNG
jgi:hypothetical protein